MPLAQPIQPIKLTLSRIYISFCITPNKLTFGKIFLVLFHCTIPCQYDLSGPFHQISPRRQLEQLAPHQTAVHGSRRTRPGLQGPQ